MPKNLLVADDSLTIRKVIGMIFSTEDFQVHTVDNGIDAINKTRELRPDIVLADVMMPGKSGYEVCQALKADPSTQGIPVMLLAGTFEAFDENRARTARADDHITKPFESQVLLDKVRALVGVQGDAPAYRPPVAAPAPTAVPVPAAAPGSPRPTRPGGVPVAGPPPPGVPRPAPRTGMTPAHGLPGAMRPGMPPPGVPVPQPGMAPPGVRPMPGMPPPGMPRPAGPGMPMPQPGMAPPGARPMPGVPAPAGMRPGTVPGMPAAGYPAPPPGMPRPMTPGAATPAGGIP